MTVPHTITKDALCELAVWLSERRTLEELADSYEVLTALREALEDQRDHVKSRLTAAVTSQGTEMSDKERALGLPDGRKVSLQVQIEKTPNDNKARVLQRMLPVDMAATLFEEVTEKRASKAYLDVWRADGRITQEQYDSCFVRREILKVRK